MDILVWGGLGNSDYLEKMMSFSNIYLYFWLKRKEKKGISRVYIWCFFICILNGLRFYDKHYR